MSVITTSAILRSQTNKENGEEVADGGVVERLQLLFIAPRIRD
jgi:hypothetical protein